MAEKKFSVPDVLPVLPVRDTVLFPGAVLPHTVGTVAKVHKTVKMPNGNVVVFLEGLQRVQVTELVTLRPYMRARVEPQPDIIGEVDAELAQAPGSVDS